MESSANQSNPLLNPQPDITLNSLPDQPNSLLQPQPIADLTAVSNHSEISNQFSNAGSLNPPPEVLPNRKEESKLAGYAESDSSIQNYSTIKHPELPQDDPVVGNTAPLIHEVGKAAPLNTPEFDEINRNKLKSSIHQTPMDVITDECGLAKNQEDRKENTQNEAQTIKQTLDVSMESNRFISLEGGISKEEKAADLPVQMDPRLSEEDVKASRQDDQLLIQSQEASQRIFTDQQEKLQDQESEEFIDLKHDSSERSNEMRPRPNTPPLNQTQTISFEISSQSKDLPKSTQSTDSTKKTVSLQSAENDKSHLPSSSLDQSQVSTKSSLSTENSKPVSSTSSVPEISLFMPPSQTTEAPIHPEEESKDPHIQTRYQVVSEPGSSNSPIKYSKLDEPVPENRNKMKTPEPRPASKSITYKTSPKEIEDPNDISFNSKSVPNRPSTPSSASENKSTVHSRIITKDKQEIKTDNSTVIITKTFCRTPPSNLGIKRDSLKKEDQPDSTLGDFSNKSAEHTKSPFKAEESIILNSGFNIPTGDSEQNTPHKLIHNIQESPEIPRKNSCLNCQEYKQKTEELQSELDSRMREEVKSVQNLDHIMENHRNELSHISKEKDNLISESVELKHRLHKFTEEAELAEPEMKDLRSQNSKLSLDNYNKNSEIDRLKKEKELSNKQNEENIKDLNSLAEENNHLKENVKDNIEVIDGHQKKINQFIEENEAIKALLKDNEAKCKTYEEEKTLQIRDIEKLTKESEMNKKLLEDSEVKYKHLEDSQIVMVKGMQRLNEENEINKGLVKELQEKCKAAEETNTALNKEKNESEVRLKDVENTVIQYADTIETLEEKLKVLTENHHKFTKDLEAGIEKISQLEGQKTDLENTHQIQAADIENHKLQVKHHLDTIQNYETHIKEHESTSHGSTSQIEELRTEVVQLKNTVKTLENDKKILSSEKTKLASLLKSIKSDLQTSEKTVQKFEATQEKLKANVADLENSLRIKQEESNNLECARNKNKHDIENSTKRIKELTDQVRSLKSSLEDQKYQLINQVQKCEGSFIIKLKNEEKNHKEDIKQLSLKLKDFQHQAMVSQEIIETLNQTIEKYKISSPTTGAQLEGDSFKGSSVSDIRQFQPREIYILIGVIVALVISYTLMTLKPF